MIYVKNGNALQYAYNKSGQSLNAAYQKSGTKVFPDGAISLKVMTYNCGQWYYGGGDNVPADKDADYYALQNGMIAQNNPDILIIQEYWKTFSKAGRTALSMLQQHFPYIHEQGGASGYYGRCICSKYPISNYTIHTYTDNNQRYYDTCKITVQGKQITIVNTHLDTTREKRETEIVELISYLQTLTRFVAAGDFNTLSCKTTTDADYTAIIVPLINAGFNLANCSDFGFIETYSDQPTGTYTGCLDNVVTSSNISIVSSVRDATKLFDELGEKTDHMPLIAEITVN